MRITATLISAGMAASTLAQTNGTYLLTSSNTVSPTSPTTTIGVWAAWDDPTVQYRFADGDYDLTASEGLFSNPTLILRGLGASAGVANGNVVTGARNSQLIIVYLPGLPVVNPILLATYDWTTDDFRPRTVTLDTSNTSVFEVGIPVIGGPPILVDLFPGAFSAGAGLIHVVPAPAAWLAIALPLVAGRRRRR